MRARANYVRVDNDLGSAPKTLELSDDLLFSAIGVLVLALGYADRQRTDGAISRSAMRRTVTLGLDADAIIAELVRVGFLEPTADGWQIVNYLDWQRSAAEIDAAIEQRREAGRRSAEERAKRAAEKETEQRTNPTERIGEERIGEDRSAVEISLNEPLNGSLNGPLSGVLEPAGEGFDEYLLDAARALSRRSPKPVTPADVAATVAKTAPDAMPSEVRRAVDLVISDGSVRVPLSIFAIRLKEARASREPF